MGTSVVNASGVKMVAAEKPAKKRIFNLDTFNKETKEVSYQYPVYNDVNQLGDLSSEELLALANAGAKRKAMLDARKSIQGASAGLIGKLVGAFKFMPIFSAEKYKNEDGSTNRTKQDKAIYEWVKSNPAMLELIKSQALEASGVDEEDDEDDEA